MCGQEGPGCATPQAMSWWGNVTCLHRIRDSCGRCGYWPGFRPLMLEPRAPRASKPCRFPPCPRQCVIKTRLATLIRLSG